jgi:hypothetical protein
MKYTELFVSDRAVLTQPVCPAYVPEVKRMGSPRTGGGLFFPFEEGMLVVLFHFCGGVATPCVLLFPAADFLFAFTVKSGDIS